MPWQGRPKALARPGDAPLFRAVPAAPMRPLVLAVFLCAPLAAQTPFDVSGTYGGALTSSLLLGDFASIGSVGVSTAPEGLRGIRLVASVAGGPGDDRGDGRLLAFGLGAELPLTRRRVGPYLALGAAFVDFDNDGPDACRTDPDCFYEYEVTGSHTGLAATAGVGARIPFLGRFWVEPVVSAYVWDEALVSGRVGLGWQIR